MNQSKHLEDIYTAIRVFIGKHRQRKVTARLQYLMMQGCWNSWVELLEAIEEVLTELVTNKDVTSETDFIHEAKGIREAIACILFEATKKPPNQIK